VGGFVPWRGGSQDGIPATMRPKTDWRRRLARLRTARRSCMSPPYRVVLVAPVIPQNPPVGVEPCELPRFKHRLTRAVFGPLRAFLACLRTEGALYHLHDPELLAVAPLLRLRGSVVLFDMHEDLPLAIRTKAWVPRVARPILGIGARLVERILLSRLPVVFAEWSYARSRGYVHRSEFVLNMPREEEFRELRRSPEVRPAVAYVGGVSEERGAIVTLQSLRLLRDRGVRLGWECVGPAAPEVLAQLRRLADTFGLPDVRFHGARPPREAWRIIRGCTVGLAVIQPKPNYVGSYPTKIFEYMALGMPVVASDFPLYRRVVEESGCGICVDPSQPSAVADAVERIVRTPGLSERMSAAGMGAVADRYNWAQQEKRLLRFYSAILGEPGP
jgi:glycosyltransferase involved in cell wall biosynthesis